MEQTITISLNEYHALKLLADSNRELKATMNLTFLSRVNDGFFLSVVTNDGQTSQDVHVIRVPKLEYLQMKKRGITEIDKNVFANNENV